MIQDLSIVVTNDDSHSSPLLRFLLRKLIQLGVKPTVAVPLHEQSLKGKSMTLFSHLHLSEIEIEGVTCFAIDGTPADCVNIGIHHLSPKPPDLVISGINAGLNASAAFVLASGTVGACLEANISGIPAIALSQAFDSATMSRYVADYSLPPAVVSRIEIQTDILLGKIFAAFIGNSGWITEPSTLNINLPFVFKEGSAPQLAELSQTTYKSCFVREGNRFSPALQGLMNDERPSTDAYLIQNGFVTVTLLRMSQLGCVDPKMFDTLQKIIADGWQ